MKIITLFKQSFFELKNVKSIVIGGLLLAMSFIIDKFTIQLGFTQLGFGFIITATASMLFGPIYSGTLAGVTDLLNHFTASRGDFFFGWTLNPILAGIVYGSFLYRKGFNINNKKELLTRLIIAKIIVSFVINLGLGTLWLSITRGQAYLVLLMPRITKEIILIPIHIIILFYVLPAINKLKID